MGVEPEERGGISTLARQILGQATEDNKIDLRYLPTTCNGGVFGKMRLFSSALIREWQALNSGYDIVHLHMANNASFLRAAIFSQIAAACGAKVVLQIHCDLAKFYESASRSYRHSIDAVLSAADRVIVMGDYLDEFLENQGVPQDKVRLLRNSVAVSSDNPYNPNARRALFLGNVCPEKGILDLLDALVFLQDSLPDWFALDICGRDLIGIETEISNRSLERIVAYRGLVDVNDAFFANYMLNILPSHNEALPFALLETSAHGIPSIVTAVGTMPEMVEDGYSGWVVPPKDVRSLARALNEAAHDSIRLKQMSKTIHQVVIAKYSIANYYESLKRLYAEVAS